jgi:hypothetical protein
MICPILASAAKSFIRSPRCCPHRPRSDAYVTQSYRKP